MLLGIDVGGTFTDAVLIADGRIETAKVPSTPGDQSQGVLAAVEAVLAGRHAGDVTAFAHGTTVATNALLEGHAARTVLVATRGHTDVVALGRQARADLYRLCARHPDPLVPPERRVAADERMAADGTVLTALEDAGALADLVAGHEPEAVAVCLLHAYAHPEHEQRIGEALRARLGDDVHVSLSHEVVGTFREYERAATTELDAALSPLLAHYLRRLTDGAAGAGLPEPVIMQSSGGLATVGQAAAHAAFTVLSGPAGGASGAAWSAAASGVGDALCFDMGGTSCDVCVVREGVVGEATGRRIGGRPVALPALDIHTVGAGGGSIGWRDAGGALRVGPQSAGARPGPAAYGHGGTEPTVTDANVVLGRLGAGSPLAGGLTLDAAAAGRAVQRLADALGLPLVDTAEGIVRVANAEMVRALRVMTVERGIDPRDLALLAFGGAGPLHAAEMADELGMRRVLCPRASGVLAALGLVVSDRRTDRQRTVLLSRDALTRERTRTEVAALAMGAGRVRVAAELRYRGQAFELAVETDDREPDPAELVAAFEAEHERIYGFTDPGGEVELVTLRVSAIEPAPDVAADAPHGEAPERASRAVVHAGDHVTATVVRGDLPRDEALPGPAVVELRESTVVVPPGWTARADATGAILLER